MSGWPSPVPGLVSALLLVSTTHAAVPPSEQSHAAVGGPAAAAGEEAISRLKSALARRQRTPDPDPIRIPAAPRALDLDRRTAMALHRSHSTTPAISARARTALEAGQTSAARTRDAMAAELGQALGLTPPDLRALAQGALPVTPQPFVPLLFVSSSMPIATLRTYAAQLERAGGAMAFRGMPGGLHQVMPMAKLTAEILRLDPACQGTTCAMRSLSVVVDPIAFRQFGITRVPALAMVPGDPAQPYCERDEAAPPPRSPRIFGDAALAGLLAEVARLGGEKEVRDAQARLVGR